MRWHAGAPPGALQWVCASRSGASRPGRGCPRPRAASAADPDMKPATTRPAARREPALAIALFLVTPLLLAIGAAAHVR